MSIFGEPLPHEDDTAASLIRRNGFPPGEVYSQLPEVYMCPCCSQLAAGAEDGDDVAWKLMAEKEAARRRLLQLDVFDERARPPRSGDAHSRLRTHRPGCMYDNHGGSREAGDGVAAPLVEVPPPPPTTHDLPRAQRTRKPLQRLVVTVHHGTHLAARDASDPLSVVVRCGAFEGQTAQVARGRGTRTTWDELFEFPYPRAADLEVLVINHAHPPSSSSSSSSSSSAERERGDGSHAASHADDAEQRAADDKDEEKEKDSNKEGGDDKDNDDNENDKKKASNASDSGSHDTDNNNNNNNEDAANDEDDEEMRQAMGGVTVQNAFLADIARGDEESVPVMHKRDMHASYDAQPEKGPLGDVWLSWRILDEGDEAAVQPNLDQPLGCNFVVRRILQYTDAGAEPYTDGVLCVLRDTDDNCSESVLYAYSGVQAPTLSAYYANSGCHYLPENTAQAMQLNTSKKLGHILLCVPKDDDAADADEEEELLVVAAVPLDLERMYHRGTAVLLIESKSHSDVVWGEVEVEWANRPLYGGDGADKDALQRRAPLPLEVSAEALFVTVVRGLNLTNNAGAPVDHVNLVVATGELEGSTVTTSNVLDVHGVDEHADEDEAGGDNDSNGDDGDDEDNDDDGAGGRAARRGVRVANWNQEIRFIGVGADKNTVELYAYEDGGLVSVGRCVLRDHDEGVVIVPMHDPHEAASMSHDSHDGNNHHHADGQAADALTTATDAAVAHGTRGEIVISYRRLHPRIENALVEVAKTQTAAERTAARRAARALHDGDGLAAAQPEHDEEDEEDEEQEEEEEAPRKQKAAAAAATAAKKKTATTSTLAHPRRTSQHDTHESAEKDDDDDEDVVAVAATEEVDKADDVTIEHAEEESEEAAAAAAAAAALADEEAAEEEEEPQHAEEEEAAAAEEEEVEEAAAAAEEEEEEGCQDEKQDEEEAQPQHAEEEVKRQQPQPQPQQPEELEVERDEAAEATPPSHKDADDEEAKAEAEAERLAAEEAARRAAEEELRAAHEQAAAARAAAAEAQEARDAAAAAAAAADRDRAAEEARAAAARSAAEAARAAAAAAEAEARAAVEEARVARERAAAAAEERRRQADAEANEARRRAEEEKAAAAAAAHAKAEANEARRCAEEEKAAAAAAAHAKAEAEDARRCAEEEKAAAAADEARRRAEDEEARHRAEQEAAEEDERQCAAEEADAARDDAAATAAAAGRGRPARAINWKPAPAYSAKYKKPFYPSGSAENESHVPFEKSSLSRKNEASIRGLESYHTRLVEESAHRERSADRHSTSSGATPRDQRQ